MAVSRDLISVIIPTYNRWPVLKRVLETLEKQTKEGWPFEVIIIDDGSKDGTVEYLERTAFSFPCCCIRQRHKGPAAARNAGLKKAGGEIVLFLNDDCLAAPDLLFQHRRGRQEFSECAIVGRIEWSSEIPLSPGLRELVNRYYFPYGKIKTPWNVHFAYFITGNLSAPLKKVLEAGGFDEDFTDAAYEDIELGYRLWQAGLRLCYNPGAAAVHYHHLDFDQFCDRQRKVAYWFYAFVAKHPEVKAFYPGVHSNINGFSLKQKQSYNLLLSYMMYRGAKAGKKAFFE
jgi:glycosyltransferase involved in cell wall biosynthesis